MWKLTWYLARTVIVATLSVIAILLGIDAIVTFIVQAGNVGQAGFTVWKALEFTLLRLPSDLYLILPVCGFLGVLFGLGALSARHELVAMRAAGTSLWQLCRGVLLGASVFFLVGLCLSSYLSPVSRHLAYYKLNEAQNKQAVLVLASHSWVKSGNHFVLIGQSLPGGRLNNVDDFVVKGNHLTKITRSPSIQVSQKNWTLSQPLITHLNVHGVTQQHLSRLKTGALLEAKLLKVLTLSPANMTVPALIEYIHYRVQNHLDASPYKLQLWSRFFQPIVVLILMLLAVPFVFGPMRSANIGVRLVVGVVIGFSFYLFNQFAGAFSAITHLSPFLGAALPSILFGILLMILLWRLS